MAAHKIQLMTFSHLGGEWAPCGQLRQCLGMTRQFTLSQVRACEVIAQVWGVVREWRVYFEQYGVAKKQVENIATAFRNIDNVSLAQLRKLLV